MDLHFCLPASGVVSHANTQPAPPLSKVTFTLCANLTHFRAEGGVQKRSDHRMSDSTPLHLHSPSLVRARFSRTNPSLAEGRRR